MTLPLPFDGAGVYGIFFIGTDSPPGFCHFFAPAEELPPRAYALFPPRRISIPCAQPGLPGARLAGSRAHRKPGDAHPGFRRAHPALRCARGRLRRARRAFSCAHPGLRRGQGKPGHGHPVVRCAHHERRRGSRRLYCRHLSLRLPGPSRCGGGACAVLHPVGPSLADSRFCSIPPGWARAHRETVLNRQPVAITRARRDASPNRHDHHLPQLP